MPKASKIAETCRLALAAAVIASIPLATHDAQANTFLCRSLEAQLVSGAKTVDSAKYVRAAERQREELGKARRQARAQDCLKPVFLRFGRSAGNSCRSLLGTIDRMEANLANLERKAGGLSSRQKRKIMASLEANNCRSAPERKLPQAVTTVAPDRRLPQLKNRFIVTGPNGEITPVPGLRPGTYRTLCVRTCDGYYFPISFSTSSHLFGRDRQICESMCPGTDVELYYHSVPGQESEDMVSLDGQPYIEHPNALRYRQANAVIDPGCTCNAPKSFSVVAGRTAAETESGNAEEQVPAANALPDPARDSGTFANLGEKTAPEADTGTTEVQRRKNGGQTGSVRVVGPAFLPDPEEAIDLKAPARMSDPLGQF